MYQWTVLHDSFLWIVGICLGHGSRYQCNTPAPRPTKTPAQEWRGLFLAWKTLEKYCYSHYYYKILQVCLLREYFVVIVVAVVAVVLVLVLVFIVVVIYYHYLLLLLFGIIVITTTITMIVIIMTIILVVARGRCRSYHCIVNTGSARESQQPLKTWIFCVQPSNRWVLAVVQTCGSDAWPSETMGLSGTMLSQCFKWSFIMFPILNWLFTRFHSVHFGFSDLPLPVWSFGL